MEYVKKKLAELKPYGNNPRINDEAVDDVVESIRQYSYIAPIVVDRDGLILAGHTRYKALKKWYNINRRRWYVQQKFEVLPFKEKYVKEGARLIDWGYSDGGHSL